jgi:glycine dehydrogenase subunit 1
MPFIPHTTEDVTAMLAAIGVPDIDTLFEEIPRELRVRSLDGIPPGMHEQQVMQLMRARAKADGSPLCFIGAGAYDHHIPAVVWSTVARGEYYSAYTPYQAEASQGTLQTIYEFQSMITALTGMQVANASLYDGATAVAEASLMAVRAHRRGGAARILLPRAVHPHYRAATATATGGPGLELVPVDYDRATGCTGAAALDAAGAEPFTALVIAVVNPTSLAVLKPPGEWGAKGADIVVGDGQPLGCPLSSGGPYFGFMAARMEHVRQMPGRIVGRTVDLDGRPGYTLTLQAREQHIRRGKATSNICTNQGLLMVAGTIYMSLMGARGLERVARACMARSSELVAALAAIPGVRTAFGGARFHEAVLQLDRPVAPVLEALAARGIEAGYDLSREYPELGTALLVCATEARSREDIAAYARALREVLGTKAASAAGRRA